MLKTINYSPGHQKLMLLFPMPVVLCLLLVFHGLGGGKGSAANQGVAAAQGINTNLPAAKTDSSSKLPDKEQIYESAAADSLRFREQQKQDPNIAVRPVAADTALHNMWVHAPVMPPAIDQRRLAADAKAKQLLAKVEQLQKVLDESADDRGRMSTSGIARTNEPVSATRAPLERIPPVEPDPAMDRLSALSQTLESNPRATRDPEMERIDAMLDKLIRIQHPDLVVGDTGTSVRPARTFALEPQGQNETVANLQRGTTASEEEDESTGFIEIGEEDKPDTAKYDREPALEAVVDGDQTVTSGSIVTLKLTKTANLNGLVVPSGQQLYGQVSIATERLMVHISSLRVGEEVLPVSIQVYDLDGLAGIRVPGAVTRQISKESASEAISGLGMASMDPSVTGQAANAGLQLAKSLTSRKIRTVRVQLPAGYQVLLVNTKTRS